MVNNNNANIFIPGINKNKIQAALIIDKHNTIAESIMLLSFSLLLRAQFALICQKSKLVGQDKIPQLETAKWLARIIARNPLIFSFTCLLAITDTLQYIINISEGESVSVEKLTSESILKWDNLKSNRPESGCRILPNSLINEKNMKTHQYGLVLQNVGKWQAISLYDHSTLLKGAKLLTLEIDNFIIIYKNLIRNLGIPELEALESKEGIITSISKNLYCDEITFYDEINLGLEDNKLPLEKTFNIKRISPVASPKVNFSEDSSNNPLLKLISTSLGQQDKLKKAKKRKI